MTEPRVALVLGAGGITGGAWEHGILSALYERTGWNPGHAHAFIGTSAGSWVATFLAAGRSMADVLNASRPPVPHGNAAQRTARRAANAALGDTSGLYTFAGRPLLSPRAWLRPASALAGSALFSTEGMVRRLRSQFPEGVPDWPHPNLRIVAFDTRHYRRTVFGKAGAPPARLDQAVPASSAIPGVFRPVVIDNVPYLDGGIASTTNLDLAAEFVGTGQGAGQHERADGVDLVICFAPMAGDRIGGRPPAGPAIYGYTFNEAIAWVARRQVERETARLRIAFPGVDVLTFRPTPEDRQAMGRNAMDGRKRPAVRQQAYLSGLSALDQPDMREVLAAHGLAVTGVGSKE
jgi:NTE family protein